MKTAKKIHIVFFAIIIVFNLFALFLWYSNKQLAWELSREDRLFENLSVLLYLAAIIISFYFVNIIKAKKIYLLIPLVSLLGILDELSWGEKTFNLDMPVLYYLEIDALHDFLEVIYYFLQNNYANWQIFPITFLIIAVIISIIFIKEIMSFFKNHKPLIFIFIALLILLIAQIIDITGLSRFQFYLEEILENDGALLFIWASLLLKYVKIYPQQRLDKPPVNDNI